MKFTVAASLVASVAGFAPSAMKGQSTKLAAEWGPSEALPFDKAPPTLDGSMVGDVGFDPFGLSTIPLNPILKDAGSDAVKDISDLNWLREAELMHGRIAQLAVVGFIWPGVFGTFPGNEWTGVDAYSTINPLEALGAAPTFAIVQIFTFMTVLERRRVIIMSEEGANYVPGDQRFGQFGWNPFGLNYSPEEFEEKRLQELKHCRLAMIGIFGLWAQASVSGMSVAEQYAGAFNAPDYWARAGYFLPEGI